MKSILRNVVVFTFLAVFASTGFCQIADETAREGIGFYAPFEGQLDRVKHERVRNIILMIGDGMGVAQVSAARIRSEGPDGELSFEKMPVVGLVKTHALDDLVTDSAASGTALATGYKTRNGMVSWLPGGNRPLTILEAARENGLRTGLIATSTMTHATPASFGAHRETRKDEQGIAEDLLNNQVDILFGGGRQFFIPDAVEGSARTDNRDLLAEAKDAGYIVVSNKEEMNAADGDRILGLFNNGALTTTAPDEPSLAEMTGKAIEILNRPAPVGVGLCHSSRCLLKRGSTFLANFPGSRNRKGFFLMVEASQIDWTCHSNDVESAVRQTLLFDEAVQKALDFALKDKRTLVIVTADHETGGLGINGGRLSGSEVDAGWTTDHHTGVQVPLYGYGPGSERFMGVMDNTEIPRRLAELLNIEDFPQMN